MATFDSVNAKRSKNWFVNAIKYHLMRCVKGNRDGSLWIFSAWEGQRYADNTRYFFEYMLANHPEITCIWQTRNIDVFQMLQEEQKPVQLIGTSQAQETQKRAGVVFYTNGLDDFGDFPSIYGARIVALWHGVGFKKIYRELYTPRNPVYKLISDLKWNFFSWVKRDVTVVTSEASRDHFIKWFSLRRTDPILIAGQPRNDVFASGCLIENSLRNARIVGQLQGKHIILYMPTFRRQGDIFMSQLEELWASPDLEKVLSEQNAIMLTKLHYLNQGDLQPTECKVLLNDEDVLDIQKLMGCADILITDYSSCAIDFALQKKPVLFYFPDWCEYGADSCMREGTREACSINCAENATELISKIVEMLHDPKMGIRQSEKLNQIFDNTGVEPGEYSENVYHTLMQFIEKRGNGK